MVILAGLAWLSFLSRREQGNLLQRMSNYLYKQCCVHKVPFIEGGQVPTDLERLYPGVPKRELQLDYYVNKFRLILLVLFVGPFRTLMFSVKSALEAGSPMDGLSRGQVGEGEQEVLLSAQIGKEKEQVSVLVAERLLTETELEGLVEECLQEVERLMLAENSAPEDIQTQLYLPEILEGYPFEIQWKSSDTELIENDGELGQVAGREGEWVSLKAVLYYGEKRFEKEFLLQLGQVKREESLSGRLKEAIINKDLESKYEEKLPLPEELDGEKIIWKRVQENKGVMFLGLTLLATVGVFFLQDKDLHDKVGERKTLLKLAYPGIVNKFVLYMGAGMTVRGSFLKIATDYQSGRGKKEENPAYDEMLYSCHELSAGVSEGLVYERFGKRSGLQEYARFVTMLGQNLKKGNSALLIRLKEEADKAMQEKLQLRKKMGEEAETKLLVPMIMLMGIVMLLVMLPAFTSFE